MENKLTGVTSTSKEGKRVSISVEEITNGYVVCTSTEYKDSKGNWQYENKKEYSETNPLDPKMMSINIIKDALGKK
jgi:hypothetical protein